MSPLVEYVKKGLKNCYMPDQKCWSYIYHLDGRAQPNQSVPYYDIFYSLNVILGFAFLGERSWKEEYDLRDILHHNARRMFETKVPTYAYGMALWASALLKEPLEKEVLEKIRAVITDREKWNDFRAQDVGIILIGLSEQKRIGNVDFQESLAHDFFIFLKNNYLSSSSLFFDHPHGYRRNFASFATQTYLTTACYHYGQVFSNEEASQIADNAVRKLISLQGPNGEWPWFYFSPKGIVVDNYEVYSVHQDGMAALFLTFAEKRNIKGAREAIIKGFNWMFGENQLGKSMLVPDKGMFYRSIIRKGELNNKKPRIIRAVINGLLGRRDPYACPNKLTLRMECRSYHLGWVLYSFGTREDLKEILYHPEFEKNRSI